MLWLNMPVAYVHEFSKFIIDNWKWFLLLKEFHQQVIEQIISIKSLICKKPSVLMDISVRRLLIISKLNYTNIIGKPLGNTGIKTVYKSTAKIKNYDRTEKN